MKDMSIFPDGLITAILGYAVVFTGLVLLMTVVILLGKAMLQRRVETTPSPAVSVPAAPAVPAPGSAGEVKLHGVSDRDAAMIMAIVAHKLDKPLNELRFKSIKEVKEDEV